LDHSDTVFIPRHRPADALTERIELARLGRIEAADQEPEPIEPPEPLIGRDLALARLAWLIPCLLTFGITLVRITYPGLWADELATWGMATTPWGQMWPILGHVDAAIAPYYAFIHVITGLLGASDLVLRLPSAIAMTAAVAIVARIGTRLAGPQVGILAGLLLAFLPTTSRYAQEARPYAIAMFAAALATLLLLRALEKPSIARYAAYAGAVALLGLAHFVALLVLGAHVIMVVLMRRKLPIPWLIAATVGVLPCLPVVYLSFHQSSQVSWIPDATLGRLGEMPGDFFMLDLLGGIMLILAFLGLSLKRPTVVFTTWALVPAALLFLMSQVNSLWLPRYLLFTLPAWALLAATALTRAPLIRGIVIVTAIALIGLPVQTQVRTAAGHNQATSALAATLAANEQPGDGIVYALNEPGGAWIARDIVAHYVPADVQPRDVFQVTPQRTGGHLLAKECSDLAACLGGAPRLWTIRNGDVTDDPIAGLGFDKERLLKARYDVAQTWPFAGLTLALLVAKPDASATGH
jgi:mannosyltransferase